MKEIISVALPVPLQKNFAYIADQKIPVGCRVIVPFSGRKLQGVVVGEDVSGKHKLKSIDRQVDDFPYFSQSLLNLAQWLSNYYQHPLGEVLRAMAPGSVDKKAKIYWYKNSQDQRVLDLFKKKERLTQQTLIKKLENKSQLDILEKEGHLRKEVIKDVEARKISKDDFQELPTIEDQEKPLLTADQQNTLGAILSQEKLRPFLIHGVTGSGKTEIYLRLIENFKQALVLVPEISLTPQMTSVFSKRFGDSVAVVHSAMSSIQRWKVLEGVRSGKTRVLIGPRSAVFAPFKNLELIVVDEEHDSSYKQTSGFCYNGRDVAVVRGKFEKAKVVLGSATPSLESIYNVKLDKYDYARLLKRVHGRGMPKISVIKGESSKAEMVNSGPGLSLIDIPLSLEIIEELKSTIAHGDQAMVLVNRRGHSYYLFGTVSQEPVRCPHCSVSLTIHDYLKKLKCHYCEYQVLVEQIMKQNPDEQYMAIGYGSEKTEQFLKEKIPHANVARLDADTAVSNLSSTLEKFRNGETNLLVGTQILAKGHDFPNVTLIVILDADQILNLPDFRAGERCFQLIVQAAGRAGRAEKKGRVILQTLKPDQKILQAAVNQDFDAFSDLELAFRKEAGFPPFKKMCVIEFNAIEERRLNLFCNRVETWLKKTANLYPDIPQKVKVYGPCVPPLEKVRKFYRRVLLLKSEDPQFLRTLVSLFQKDFLGQDHKVRVSVDIDPQSLM